MWEVGVQLERSQLVPDVAYTSKLRRSHASHDVLLKVMRRESIPVKSDWRLNERHYGALTGLSKAIAVDMYGASAVFRWRRSFDAVPPALEAQENLNLLGQAYDLPIDRLPNGESLAQVVDRVNLCWSQVLLPALSGGKCVLVTAHGNSLRALMMLIEGISEADIVSLEVANAVCLVYQWEASGRLVRAFEFRPSIETPSIIL